MVYLRRKGGGYGKSKRGDARNSRKKPIAQTKRQWAETNCSQVQDAVTSQDLAKGHEAVILANHSVHIAAEHGPASQESAQATERARRRNNRPSQRKPVHETSDSAGC